MATFQKLVTIFSRNPILNSFILFMLLACLGIFVRAIVSKFATEDDNQTDLMKLILLTVNICGFVLISLGRHINLYQVFRLKVVLLTTYVVLFVGVVVNYMIMTIRLRHPEIENPLGFNVDSLTLAMTLLSDSMFLQVYIFFRSTKILMLTVILMTIEMVVFGVSFYLGTDDVIDVVNLSTSMVSLLFSVIFWTGDTVFEGHGKKFVHFYENVDDMQTLHSVQGSESSKSINAILRSAMRKTSIDDSRPLLLSDMEN
ncbi:hypothetical protein BGZ99_007185 [Dissophora globulifera]|uniref:Uncharacterized protein n=1 Tax=Dissophora globulifera TaxID=979702 RepID=A0A9P6UR28_9FUNG|nr:hypothetical protein BGZ99_007185 [Dissophora globulifera]